MSAGARARKLVFIGFMGAGKTAAAAAVAERLGERLADSDEEIERRHGSDPATLIEREGEPAFRRLEQEVVAELLAGEATVLALGGGAVETPAVREALAGEVCVWCEISTDEAWSRVGADSGTRRPLAADRAGFEERHAGRLPLYEQLATAVLPAADAELPVRAAPFLALLRERPGARLAWGRSASGEYPVLVGRGLLEAEPLAAARRHGWKRLGGRRFLVTDPTVGPLYAKRLGEVADRVEAPAGEEAKSLGEAERVLRELAQAGMTREDHLLALGGGVVGDLAGFCAATYQRGVEVVQLPTTLVGQVDSAYGGKTGVDLPEAKNYVGAYHLPSAVIADPATLASLPREELAAGFAEVVKTALIAGGELWRRVRELDVLAADELDEVIFACARTKLAVVAADERDRGARAALNLGHTVGHAIEQATGYRRYRHGEAVGLGLLAALRLSGAEGLREEVRALLTRHGLPVELDADVDTNAIEAAVGRDKKRDAGGVQFVLCEAPGDLELGQRVDADTLSAAIAELASQGSG